LSPTARFDCINRICGWRLPDAYPIETAVAHKIAKVLISLAHPTRFERVTFAFGGPAPSKRVSWLRGGSFVRTEIVSLKTDRKIFSN
jgi:hypothetical protein